MSQLEQTVRRQQRQVRQMRNRIGTLEDSLIIVKSQAEQRSRELERAIAVLQRSAGDRDEMPPSAADTTADQGGKVQH